MSHDYGIMIHTQVSSRRLVIGQLLLDAANQTAQEVGLARKGFVKIAQLGPDWTIVLCSITFQLSFTRSDSSTG